MPSIRSGVRLAAVIAVLSSAIPASAVASDYSLPSTFATDSAQSVATAAAFPPAGFRGGDLPVDHPGVVIAGRRTTIPVAQPQRTIIREVNDRLPIVLAAAALALVVFSLAFTLVRTGGLPWTTRSQ
jgi:hypothetical protein